MPRKPKKQLENAQTGEGSSAEGRVAFSISSEEADPHDIVAMPPHGTLPLVREIPRLKRVEERYESLCAVVQHLNAFLERRGLVAQVQRFIEVRAQLEPVYGHSDQLRAGMQTGEAGAALRDTYDTPVDDELRYAVERNLDEADQRYIAAMQPDAALQLVREIRRLKRVEERYKELCTLVQHLTAFLERRGLAAQAQRFIEVRAQLGTLADESDQLLAGMQTGKARAALRDAYDASVDELGRAAVAAARQRNR
jgi:elongation factor P--beta-lysine ligase